MCTKVFSLLASVLTEATCGEEKETGYPGQTIFDVNVLDIKPIVKVDELKTHHLTIDQDIGENQKQGNLES